MLKFKTNSQTLNFLDKFSLIYKVEKIFRFFVIKDMLEILEIVQISIAN